MSVKQNFALVLPVMLPDSHLTTSDSFSGGRANKVCALHFHLWRGRSKVVKLGSDGVSRVWYG